MFARTQKPSYWRIKMKKFLLLLSLITLSTPVLSSYKEVRYEKGSKIIYLINLQVSDKLSKEITLNNDPYSFSLSLISATNTEINIAKMTLKAAQILGFSSLKMICNQKHNGTIIKGSLKVLKKKTRSLPMKKEKLENGKFKVRISNIAKAYVQGECEENSLYK